MTKILRSAWLAVCRWTARTVTDVGVEEVLLAVFVVSLILIGVAFWDLYRPASFGIPGLILLWVALPPRRPFFLQRPANKSPRS